jgi:hypothetical protein
VSGQHLEIGVPLAAVPAVWTREGSHRVAWAATSFNIMKIVRNVARLRAEFAALAAATEV